MIRCLFYLLRRFLLRGPDLLSPVKHNKKIMVGELAIDVLTPSPVYPYGLMDEYSNSLPQGFRKGLMNSKTALSVTTYMMDFLLDRSKYSASYADLDFD